MFCVVTVPQQTGLPQKIIVPHNASQASSAGLTSPTIITTVARAAVPGINVVPRQPHHQPQQKVVVSHIAVPGTLTSSTSKHQQVSVQGAAAAVHGSVPIGKFELQQCSACIP